MSIQLIHTISVSEYNSLRKVVGWSELEENQAQRGLENTYYLSAAIKDKQTVGMIRVISDGGYVAFIVDVIVHPAYQGQGIGKTLVQDSLKYIEENLAQDGLMVMINLMAAKGKEAFYEKCGFQTRPNDAVGAGMCLYINKK